jgi:hypothetical protein
MSCYAGPRARTYCAEGPNGRDSAQRPGPALFSAVLKCGVSWGGGFLTSCTTVMPSATVGHNMLLQDFSLSVQYRRNFFASLRCLHL